MLRNHLVGAHRTRKYPRQSHEKPSLWINISGHRVPLLLNKYPEAEQIVSAG